jgi:hypothetical protein
MEILGEIIEPKAKPQKGKCKYDAKTVHQIAAKPPAGNSRSSGV